MLLSEQYCDLPVAYLVARGSGPLFAAPALWRHSHETAGPPQGRMPECAARRDPDEPARRHALVVATFGALAYILVLYAVTMAPLSHVAPAREVSMLFAALLGGRLLDEGDRGVRIAGAACIAAGVIALASA